MRIFTCMKTRENSFTLLIFGLATRCTGLSNMMSRMHGLFVGKYYMSSLAVLAQHVSSVYITLWS